ncbi:MAG TPA: hypothetical protein VM030_08735 [Acidimicrobiales bacterium]|nr:hypothetical protein [Acidimicrobiales bacterium]
MTIALALGLVAAGCGSDDDKAADDTTTTAAAAKTPPVFEFHATDDAAGEHFKFSVPENVTGGAVTLKLVNDGKELHDLQLVKAAPGHTLAEFLKEFGSEEAPVSEWIEAAGGVGGTPPGQTNQVTLELEPGTYWYVCTESTEKGEKEISHANSGMSGEITIAGDSEASLPDTDASIVAKEYSFAPTGLKAGKNTFTFTNEGAQLHHAGIVPLMPGKTFADAKAALTSQEEPTGPPPIDFEKSVFTAVVSGGKSMVVDATLAAGTYALLCFMPDKGTAGPPHVAKGMLVELKVA